MEMTGRFDDLIEDVLKIREYEGENKVISLREAIARYVRPGTNIHLADLLYNRRYPWFYSSGNALKNV